MKKNLPIIIIISVIFILTIGYKIFKENHTQGPSSPGKIIIGMETWPGYLPLIVARDKGYFKDAGLDVELNRYVTLGELSKDYIAGKMQGRANLTLDAVNEYFKGLDHKAVLVIDYSNGSDAIMAHKGINSVKDFKGKWIGFEPGTLEEFFLSWALKENGMSLSDIVPVPAGPQKTPQLLKDGRIEVAVSHEPFISELSTSGDFHIVYSSADAPGLITDILTFRSDFIQSYPEAVEAIVDVYFKALAFWKENPQEACVMVAQEFGDTPESIAKQLQGVTMLDEENNRIAFTFAAGFESLYGNMRQTASFVRQYHGINIQNVSTDKIDELIDQRFIKSRDE